MTETAAPTTPTSPDYAVPAPARHPRIWPALVIVVLQWLAIKIPSWVAPGTMMQFFGIFYGPLVGAVAILIWWLFASRVPWIERITGLAAFIAGGAIAYRFSHPSIQVIALATFSLPVATTVWALWAAIARRRSTDFRRLGLVIVLLIAWSFFTLLRLNGLSGSLSASISWRWSKTSEEIFMASLQTPKSQPTTQPATSASALTLSSGDWPAFRGPMRDGRLAGVRISTDWSNHPPKQLWRHRIGPAWSSFAVIGDRIFTQEQRGSAEVVTCYGAATGEELWAHSDNTRFEEVIAGPGPRATPTFHDGKLYTFGANGRLNCLDPLTGNVIWTADAAAQSNAKPPTWGFSSSPLIAHGLVTVITGGKDKSVVAYDALTGKPAWSAGDGWSYASPQLAQLGGVELLLFITRDGAAGLDPITGQSLWQHHWPLAGNMNRITQPTVIGADQIIFGASFGYGSRSLRITHEGPQWKNQELWTSRSLKPYYNDGVLHQGHFYGFDGNVLTCINVGDGTPRWRKSGYGNGQVLLLQDQQLLLILSDEGEAALVDAKPDAHHELSRFEALNGKTWNHPVIAHNKLFVRNAEEAACYDVSP